MVPAKLVKKRRAPSTRVKANHARLIAATTHVLAHAGYSNLNYSALARTTGHSVTTVSKHFAEPISAAAAAWQHALSQELSHALAKVFDAAGIGTGRGSKPAFLRAMDAFANPTPQRIAATELLVVAGFEPELETAVAHTLGIHFEDWCLPQHGAASSTLGAQRAFVAALALGLTLLSNPHHPHLNDTNLMLEALYKALRHPTQPKLAPEVTESMPMDNEDFQARTGDKSHDRLLNALLEVVGKVGLDRATTMAIGEAAGATEGLLFSRYRTKLDAFLDALEHHQRTVIARQQTAAMALSERYGGPAVDHAVAHRTMLPHRKKARNVALEEIRMLRYHPTVRARYDTRKSELAAQLTHAVTTMTSIEAQQRVHYGLAMGIGFLVVPIILPAANQLPLNVVFEAF